MGRGDRWALEFVHKASAKKFSRKFFVLLVYLSTLWTFLRRAIFGTVVTAISNDLAISLAVTTKTQRKERKHKVSSSKLWFLRVYSIL